MRRYAFIQSCDYRYKHHKNVSITSYQLKLIKMRAELANLNHCAVPFLSRADVNLCWYYTTFILAL